MEFSRPEYWSGLPFPSPEDLSNIGIESRFPALQEDSWPTEPQGKPPRMLEWVACPFLSGCSWPRSCTGVSCIAGRFFTNWARLRKALNLAYHNQINFSKVLVWPRCFSVQKPQLLNMAFNALHSPVPKSLSSTVSYLNSPCHPSLQFCKLVFEFILFSVFVICTLSHWNLSTTNPLLHLCLIGFSFQDLADIFFTWQSSLPTVSRNDLSFLYL